MIILGFIEVKNFVRGLYKRLINLYLLIEIIDRLNKNVDKIVFMIDIIYLIFLYV